MSTIWKRIVSVLLAAVIITVGMMPSVVFADEYSDAYYWLQGLQKELEFVDIEASQNIISFGHIRRGAPTFYQTLTVTSYSSDTIYLDYQLCDAEEIFTVGTQDSLYLAPGQSATLYIGVDENKPRGYYTANLILCPYGFISSTINVGLSAEIVDDGAKITYIGVKPNNIDMSRNSSYRFNAEVQGDNNPNYGVEWKVSGNNSSNTTIDNDGNLKISQDETATRLEVKATSVQDNNWSATATVNIKDNNYFVSAISNPYIGGATTGGGTYAQGSNVEVYAAPNNGFRFLNWTRNGQIVSTTPKYTVSNLRENYDLVANYEQVNCYVKVSATHSEGGIVSPSGNVSYNDSYNLSATPNTGFEFEGWYEDGKRISDKSNITINNIVTNREFTANFEQNVYQVQLQVNPQGAGVVAGEGKFTKGSNVAISAKALDDYEFDCWTVNGNLVSRDAKCNITKLDKDYNLVANFRKKEAIDYTISAKVAEGNGTITPDGTVNVPEGVDITYTFSPAKDYTISSVVIDGKDVGIVPNYTFVKLDGDHTISVSFVQIQDEEIHSDVVDEDITPVEEFFGYTELTGILQEYNISEEEARSLIEKHNDIQLLEKACEEQYLAVSVVNEYADNKQETESTSYMNVSSVPNFAEVVDSLLSEDEKLALFKGEKVAINFNLFSNNKLEGDDNKKLANRAIKDKYEIGNFFEIVFLKSGMYGDQVVTSVNIPMKIELNVPSNLRAEGRQFYIMRLHSNDDGTSTIDYLPNESTDQSKIVFTTDKFSSYAIAYKGGKSSGLTQSDYVKILFGVIAVAVILTIILIGIIIRMTRKNRRRR